MPHLETGNLFDRAYFITVPLLGGCDANKVARAVNCRIRSYFGFKHEKCKSFDNPYPCVGIISCPDFQDTRYREITNATLSRKGPHIHTLLFVPQWLERNHPNLQNELSERLALIREVPREPCGDERIFIERVEDKGKSLNHIAAYVMKAEEKVPRLAWQVEWTVFPYVIWEKSPSVDSAEYSRRVNELAIDLVMSVDDLQFPEVAGIDPVRQRQWLKNQM